MNTHFWEIKYSNLLMELSDIPQKNFDLIFFVRLLPNEPQVEELLCHNAIIRQDCNFLPS